VKTWFVDSNVFLRFLTTDDEGHHEKAVRFLQRASRGEIRLVCGPPVLFELAWTLRTSYKVSRVKVHEILRGLFAMPSLTMTDAPLVQDALTRAGETGAEFADAYIAASAEASECAGVATFNRKDFSRLGVAPAESS
jgi:predicted nucleic acid-binding protein